MIHIPKNPHSKVLRWDDPSEPCTFDAGNHGLIHFVLIKKMNGVGKYDVEIINRPNDQPLNVSEQALIKSIIIKHASITGYGEIASKTDDK